MVINWYGESCFKIQTGGLTILTDPFESSIGLTAPRLKAEIVLETVARNPVAYEPRRDNHRIVGPGEYEASGIEIVGWPLPKGSSGEEMRTFFRVNAEELRLGLLGHIAENGEDLLDKLGEIDVLFVPAGGAPFLAQRDAAKLIKQVNPKIVIPMLFKIPGLKRKTGDLKEFLAEVGQAAAPQEKLVVKKRELPAATKVMPLSL